MSTARPRASRVFTISFPEPLAQQVEQTARDESRNISELFREAFRAYKFQALERQLETMRPPDSPAVTEAEIQAYISEVRRERSTSRKASLDRRP